jgi:AGZA family xanthine/uracil permease-like MFS transporter
MIVIESGAGIAEGGKTGLTAMVCGLCFVVSMFFAPIFASIPPWATGCTLILVSPAHDPKGHLPISD